MVLGHGPTYEGAGWGLWNWWLFGLIVPISWICRSEGLVILECLMEKKDVLSALSALSQETRLDIFRLLI